VLRLLSFAAACALGLAACAGPTAVAPTRAGLEARVAEDPDDVEALRDLGALLAVEEEYGPALGTFARALALDPTDGQTLYFAGLVSEALDRPAEAEDTYARYLNVEAGDVYRDSLRARLNGLVRARLQREFAEALAVEDSVTAGPAGDAVGVLPFAYRGDDAEYQALGRGLAEVLSIDLASVRPLEVVERARLQALLAEYDLARQGVLDPATAPTAGRLLRAGRLVGGEVDVQGEALRVESAVWADSLRQLETTEGGVEDLFRVQKTITLDVLDALGVQVAEADRARLMEAPTTDLLAFLLYSRALLQEDDGDFVGAARLYNEALERDPSFALAAQGREGAARSASAARPAGQTLAAAAITTLEPVPAEGPSAVQDMADGLRETLVGHVIPGEGSRNPGVEASRAGALGPLPDPPVPPPAGQNQP
jgi:TolB-like protein